ncbi:MAG: c-type cytochrome [Alphaproteobacteria bacterium]
MGMTMRAALVAALGFAVSPAGAASLEEGRATYTAVCGKCHGQITEQLSRHGIDGRIWPAVMSPLGPNLTGIFGRPAGTIGGYRYSNAMRKAAPGIVWDAPSLDVWLANSQAMIKGSYMFLKLKPEKRAVVIEYLEKVAKHRR